MPSILYPSAIEIALKAKPPIPRLKTWYETPALVAGALLPLVPLGSAALSLMSKGWFGVITLMLPIVAVLFLVKATLVQGGRDLLKIARRGNLVELTTALTWLKSRWYRLPLALASLALPAAGYCWMANYAWGIFSPILKLSRSSIPSALIWSWHIPLAIYLIALMAGILWGILKQGSYNNEFRRQYQEYQRQNTNLDLFQRRQLWDAVRGLPRADFDGRQCPRGKSTPATLLLLRALQSCGYRLADRPGRENDEARLIPEYELVGLRLGFKNYRADLAIVCPAKNVKIDIELDGGYHYTPAQRVKDQVRNHVFLNRGWIVIRFDNEEVESDPAACAARVHQVMTTLQAVPFEVSTSDAERIS